jgi:alkylhydroperoxidase/carboxymuconolactone decarboxylase family protein YurZ
MSDPVQVSPSATSVTANISAEAFALMRDWDDSWTHACEKMMSDPWTNGILPVTTVELICVAINAACTNLQREATGRHISAALAAGATRDEIFMVLRMASLLSIHSCSLGAPILLEEARSAAVEPAERAPAVTPVTDSLRAAGLWNEAWTPFYDLDPAWTDQVMAVGINVYSGKVLSLKLAELLSIALDASYTHMYAPGTRRHIRAALALGASVEEIMEVLKLCVIQGFEAANLAAPILAEEIANAGDAASNARGTNEHHDRVH